MPRISFNLDFSTIGRAFILLIESVEWIGRRLYWLGPIGGRLLEAVFGHAEVGLFLAAIAILVPVTLVVGLTCGFALSYITGNLD